MRTHAVLSVLASLPLLVLAGACALTRGEVSDPVAVEASSSAQFELLRSLEGEWSGTIQHEGQPVGVEVYYRVTGAGSAVEERLFPGTEHEMVTMYHRDGPWLLLTHYCAEGNQPRMRALRASPPASGVASSVEFEFLDATNLASDKVQHMHGLRLELTAPDRLIATWTSWTDGKPGHAARFEFQRRR